jgi:hypothetical protein
MPLLCLFVNDVFKFFITVERLPRPSYKLSPPVGGVSCYLLFAVFTSHKENANKGNQNYHFHLTSLVSV